ncbi:hypothetical protein ABMA28_017123 [Loxostege sticticalis]|uniref:Lipase n=1 Tax=Loxostege sticticalis TaxID=481309 RepID=A0ABD0T772_LOXSC
MAFVQYATNILTFLVCVLGTEAELPDHALIPAIRPNFTQLAEQVGLPCEEVQVTTEDGYILDMFHIPGNKSHPVLLQSGNFGSSDDYMIRGNTSLPYVLWEAGYDVWVGNVRGCRYGRRHVSFDPDLDDEFWDFSFHEFAVYDTSAMIDYILNRTEAKTLSSIGWSYGTAVNYILGAEKPEYNDLIDCIISLAPIAYLHHSIPFEALIPVAPLGFDAVILTDKNEIMGENSTEIALLRDSCSTPIVAHETCLKAMDVTFGFNPEQIEVEFAPKIFQHYPSSTSRKNLMHEFQTLTTKRFAQYDYGPEENKIIYGSEEPKEYDLSKNKINIFLISGKNDQASKLGDVALLKPKLPNVVEHIILKPEKFCHLDFVCGKDTHKNLYKPIILPILKKYNNNIKQKAKKPKSKKLI